MKIVCLGDSLTYGYGVPRKDGWVSLAAQATGHTLVNKGVSGDTLPEEGAETFYRQSFSIRVG